MRTLRLPAAVATVSLVLLGAACTGIEPADQAVDDRSDRSDVSASHGMRLVEQRGCLSCHTTDGSSSRGPTFEGLAGSMVELRGGRMVTADDAYLLRSILDPDAEIVNGFPEGVMAGGIPSPLSKEEAQAIVAYLLDLGSRDGRENSDKQNREGSER